MIVQLLLFYFLRLFLCVICSSHFYYIGICIISFFTNVICTLYSYEQCETNVFWYAVYTDKGKGVESLHATFFMRTVSQREFPQLEEFKNLQSRGVLFLYLEAWKRKGLATVTVTFGKEVYVGMSGLVS